MIDASTVDWVKMTRIASAVTLETTGKACIVRASDEAGSWGSQGYDGRFWEIELNLSQPRDVLLYTYLHELGHAAHEHVKKPIKAGGVTLRTVDTIPDADFREGVRARLYTIEAEADHFAKSAMGVFMRELGMAWREWPFVGTVAGNRA